ncbi:MAG: primosomal protein N' [Methylovulum sp.]|nr:MAG: primosomal protein N' [Methylovulum sp.]
MAKLHNESGLIFRVALPVPIDRLFDYLAPLDCHTAHPGARLEVPFGKHKKIGFLVDIVQHSEFPVDKLKPVLRVLDAPPLLSAPDLQLLHWASRYYHHPLGEVISTAFPVALRRHQSTSIEAEKRYELTDLGKSTDSGQLKRAPKQKATLEMFQAHSQALTAPELSQWDKYWRVAVQQLIAKRLLQAVSGGKPANSADSLNRQDDLPCNPPQQAAITAVCENLGQFGVYLLEGVTGSGKTEVYMQIIRSVLERGLQVLVLVPEITLTPQLEERFRQRFSVDIAVSHSKLTDNQRRDAWLQIQQGTSAILLGTRSALFTPLKNPGLIILDEEHDASFKQQEGFRFSARDVAVVRGKLLAIPVVLGSATPSLESLHNVDTRRYRRLHLPERAGQAIAPQLQLLDIRNKKMHEGLSEALIDEIKKTLAKNEQVLLFLNRRGFAPTLICHSCGWVARCLHCDANLVIHSHDKLLRCHHCGKEQRLPEQCPACKTGALTALGLGTERVENVLTELFAGKTIARLDRDSTQRKGSLEAYLERINQGHIDIILGTQMLAKGHHFPNVTLVAILDVDSGLFSIDFHASEKLAQMIVQVSGRAGRADKRGKVIMQTRRPEHPLLTTLINEGYSRFAETALAERQLAELPPFSYQALLRAQAADDDMPQSFLQAVLELAQGLNTGDTQMLGPVPAPMTRRAGVYRYQLLFQSGKRPALHRLLDELMPKIGQLKPGKKLRWSLDVDPVDLY